MNNTPEDNISQQQLKEYETFDDMELRDELLRAIYGYGYEMPSVIQSKAIVPISQGIDIIAQSQSGTGKTGSFSIGSLQRIDESIKMCQVIAISPTRELADQTAHVYSELSLYMKCKVVKAFGGTQKDNTMYSKLGCASVTIGTPGRLIDLIKSKILKLDNLKTIILDEADELFSNSFREQIKELIYYIPMSVQVCLFSATVSDELVEIANQIMKSPLHVLIKPEDVTLEGIKQYYVDVAENRYKYDTIKDLYQYINISQSIIYVNAVKIAINLNDRLIKDGYTVGMIHGKMQPVERMDIIKKFRKGEMRVLISTDLLARGIDVQQVSMVINYDVPNDKESYIHRIGRSGRFGRTGTAINFVTHHDSYKIKEIENFYSIKIEEMPDPSSLNN